MNQFINMLVDNLVFKILLTIFGIATLIDILCHGGMLPVAIMYTILATLYFKEYKKSKLKVKKNRDNIINTIVFVISAPGFLLYLLATKTLNLIIKVAKSTLIKFR